MLKRVLAVGLAALILTGCGGDSTKTTKPRENGALFTTIGDAPACDILILRMNVSSLRLTTTDGQFAKDVFSATSIKVNPSNLRDTSTIVNLSTFPEGTYGKAQFGYTIAQIVVFDPSQDPPVRIIGATLSDNKPEFSIEPPLTITKGKVSALHIDFDMLRSLEVDAQGQITGKVTPVVKVTPIELPQSSTSDQFDDVSGFVRSVSANAAGDFIGSFTLQLLQGSGPALSVSVKKDTTALYGIGALGDLLTGSFVEVEGFFDDKGNFVANSAEVEDRESPETNKLAFIGPVMSVTRDADGNLTQFELFLEEEEPDAAFSVPLEKVAVVNVSPSTVYQYSSRSYNFANLPFDSTSIAVGQEVIVHGVYTTSTDQPTSIAADRVYLRLQSMEGNFSSLVEVGSDDRTGGFWLGRCATLAQGVPVLVITRGQTQFVDVSGLTALTPQPSLLIRGLAFYQPNAEIINGIAVPAGTLVMLAKQVHQL